MSAICRVIDVHIRVTNSRYSLYPLLQTTSLLLSQALQREHGCSDVVFCQVHLLRPVSLSDPLRLSHPRAGKLPHQELQLCQPLPVSRVSYSGNVSLLPAGKTGPRCWSCSHQLASASETDIEGDKRDGTKSCLLRIYSLILHSQTSTLSHSLIGVMRAGKSDLIPVGVQRNSPVS